MQHMNPDGAMKALSDQTRWRGWRRAERRPQVRTHLVCRSAGRTIVLLTQYFYPEVGGTAQRLTELAVDLRRRGMSVTVLTGQPTYSRGPRLARLETHHDVPIERLPMPYLDRTRPYRRIASALLFTLLALARLLGSPSREPLVIVTNPPILPLVGLILSRLRRRRYVCLVHDVYPDVAVHLGYLKSTSIVVKFWRWLNSRIYKGADAVIVLGTGMEAALRRTLPGGAHARISVIHNWEDADFIVPRAKEDNWFSARYGTRDKLTVLYAGNMGMFHDLTTLVEAARQLRGRDDVQFLFVGDGGQHERVVNLVQQWDLSNVRFLPYQPRELLPYMLTCGDLSAVTLARGTEGLSVPGKLYTALAAGQAILAIVGAGSDVARIVEGFRCGIRLDQGDAQGVARALVRLREDPIGLAEMKRNARKCFEARFTKNQAVDRYFEILSEVGGR